MSCQENSMRYLVADEPNGLWGHLLGGNRLVASRFVYDREDGAMLCVQLRNDATGEWHDAEGRARAGLVSSLVDDNSDAIDDPGMLGLNAMDVVPDWAESNAPGFRA